MVKKKDDKGVEGLREYVETQRFLTIQEMIRRRRRAHITRSSLARRIGSTLERIVDIETGVADPNIAELELIAKELRCTVTDLLPSVSKKAQAFGRQFQAVGMPIQIAVRDLLRRLMEAAKKDRGAGT